MSWHWLFAARRLPHLLSFHDVPEGYTAVCLRCGDAFIDAIDAEGSCIVPERSEA